MTSGTTTVAQGSLLGADFDAVRARYGTPMACAAGGGVLQFSYPVNGVPTPDAVLVVDDVVVGIRDGIGATPPATGIAGLLGAGIEQVLAQLGSARAVDVGATHSRFAFAGGEILLYEGRVVAVEPAEPSVAANS